MLYLGNRCLGRIGEVDRLELGYRGDSICCLIRCGEVLQIKDTKAPLAVFSPVHWLESCRVSKFERDRFRLRFRGTQKILH